VKALIALVIAWCLLVAGVVVATSTERFPGWDTYLAGAAIVVGLAIVIAILLLP
jgi:hypothetical protein